MGRAVRFFTFTLMITHLADGRLIMPSTMLGGSSLTASLPVSTIGGMFICTFAAIMCLINIVYRLLYRQICNEGTLTRYATIKLGVEHTRITVDSLRILYDVAKHF
jgi:hypothetical protein